MEITDRPDADYATIAGLVLTALGRIPTEPGDRVVLTEWTVEVTAIDRHAITEVRLHRTESATAQRTP